MNTAGTTAVILAGGRGSRLAPLAEEFEKPLFEVDGRPLIDHSVRFAATFGASKIVIVASVATRSAVTGMYGVNCATVVQEEPTGPRDALAAGLRDVDDDRAVLILCSDNTYSPGGERFRWVVERAGGAFRGAVGAAYGADPDGRLSVIEDGVLLPKRSDYVLRPRWCGPLFAASAMRLKRAVAGSAPELRFETVLSSGCAPLLPVTMFCEDRGVAP